MIHDPKGDADLPAISEMVREGVVRWIDRGMFQARINGAQHFTRFQCDVYQLTLKGIQLRNDNGIKQR